MNSVPERSVCNRKATEWLSLKAMRVGKISPAWSNRKVSTAKVNFVWATSGKMIKKTPAF
jgi:hypothetical protein